MNATGGADVGHLLDAQRAYEKRPSTHSATITMVAKTGLLMETRVIHMAAAPRLTATRRRTRRRADATGAALAATTAAFVPSRRLSKRAASTCAPGGQALQHLDPPGRLVAPPGGDRAAQPARRPRSPTRAPGRRRAADGRRRHASGAGGRRPAPRAPARTGRRARLLRVRRAPPSRRSSACRPRPPARCAPDAPSPAARRPRRCTCTGMPGVEQRDLVRADGAGQLQPRQVDDGHHRAARASASRRARHAAWRPCPRSAPRSAASRHVTWTESSWAFAALDLRARGLQRGARVLQRDRRDELLVGQLLVGRVGALGLRERRARGLEHRVALGDAGSTTRPGPACRAPARPSRGCLRPRTAPATCRRPWRARSRLRRHQRAGEVDRSRACAASVGCTTSRCVNSSVTSGLPLALSALRPMATPAINATATTAANPPTTHRLLIVDSFLPLS